MTAELHEAASGGDPLNETADEVAERCRQRIDEALERMGALIYDGDREAIRDIAMRSFPMFCGALQDARKAGAKPYQMRAATLLVLNNIFFETVCVLTPRQHWDFQTQRFLRQLLATIKEGHGRP